MPRHESIGDEIYLHTNYPHSSMTARSWQSFQLLPARQAPSPPVLRADERLFDPTRSPINIATDITLQDRTGLYCMKHIRTTTLALPGNLHYTAGLRSRRVENLASQSFFFLLFTPMFKQRACDAFLQGLAILIERLPDLKSRAVRPIATVTRPSHVPLHRLGMSP